MVSITKFSWGEVVTQGKNQPPEIWKDCVIAGNTVSEWNWQEDGTRHHPGITVEAYERIKHCAVIVLSTGVHDKLEITLELLELLSKRSNVYILNSEEAVRKYTTLKNTGAIGAIGAIGMLLHSTC